MSWSLYGVAATCLQVLLCLAGAPLVLGVMRSVRCRVEGRTGPSPLQPWRDLRKLLTKQRTVPDQASIVFRAAPVLLLATTVVVVAGTPILYTRPWLSGASDLFVIVFMLLLGSVGLALAALDTGTAFGGMGSSRLMAIVALAEPALLMAILALAATARSSSLERIVLDSLQHPALFATPQRLLAAGAILVVILAESGRLPVDNTSTHLELTMIHEALILEYSGPDLAFVTLGESMRLTFLLSLLCSLFAPWGIASTPSVVALVVACVAVVVKVGVLALVISIGEVFVAKLRLFRVPELLAGAFVLSVLAVLSALVIA